mmetsp:Transcript_70926/g.189383  ORF Transcript_70926/g.189383 Transcript_70926/m.189383 type:complete len:137 (-) Transcript_70926:203-613(-)
MANFDNETVQFDGKGNSNLRGCIGNLSPIGLHDGVKKYAAVSAFEDRRFSPISADEVPMLECSVTFLSNFEEAANYVDWEIGKHGMIINFSDDRGSPLSATYLPYVCSEQGTSEDLNCSVFIVWEQGGEKRSALTA